MELNSEIGAPENSGAEKAREKEKEKETKKSTPFC